MIEVLRGSPSEDETAAMATAIRLLCHHEVVEVRHDATAWALAGRSYGDDDLCSPRF